MAKKLRPNEGEAGNKLKAILEGMFPDKSDDERAQILLDRLNEDRVTSPKTIRARQDGKSVRFLKIDDVHGMLRATHLAESRARALAKVLGGIDPKDFGAFSDPQRRGPIDRLAQLRGAATNRSIPLIPSVEFFQLAPRQSGQALFDFWRSPAQAGLIVTPPAIHPSVVASFFTTITGPHRLNLVSRFNPQVPPRHEVLRWLLRSTDVSSTAWMALLGIRPNRPESNRLLKGRLRDLETELGDGDFDAVDGLLAHDSPDLPALVPAELREQLLDRLLSLRPAMTHTLLFSADQVDVLAGMMVEFTGPRRALVIAPSTVDLDELFARIPGEVPRFEVPFLTNAELAEELSQRITRSRTAGRREIEELLRVPSVAATLQDAVASGLRAPHLCEALNAAMRDVLESSPGGPPLDQAIG